MGVGDEILAAGMAQRLFERDGRRVVVTDRWNQPRWHDIWDGNPVIARPREVRGGVARSLHRLRNASGCRPYIVYPFSAATGWKFNTAFRARDYVARIYLTAPELQLGTAALARHGPYVLIEPWTKHGNFRWPAGRWAALVEACPDLTFLQHTHAESRRPVPGAVAVPPTTFRETCGLLASARAYVRSESGLCHAAAALGVRTVTLWGGCMDSQVLGGYPRQVSLVDDGPGSPCGRWNPCAHCSAAMDRITVDAVAGALRSALALREAAA